MWCSRTLGSVLNCRFLGTTPDPLWGWNPSFPGDSYVQNNVRATGLMKCQSEPLFRCSTKQSSDIEASTPPAAKPPDRRAGQNPLEWREHWPGIRIPDAHIPFFFEGMEHLACAYSSVLCILTFICGFSSLLETYSEIGHVLCRGEKERERIKLGQGALPAAIFFSLHKSK